MKKLFSLAALSAVCFLISCEGGGAKSGNSKNLEANREIYKAIETGDTSKMTIIADDAVDHDGPNGEVKGGATIKAMLADFHNHIKDLKMEVITDAANEDYVFTLVHMTGTTTDDKMGMPAGQKMVSKSVDVVKFKDGKATDHWGFMSQSEVMQMMKMHNMPGMKDSTMKMKKDSM